MNPSEHRNIGLRPFQIDVQIPVKGVNCQHLNYFDLAEWLRGGLGPVADWRCLCCQSNARPQMLRATKRYSSVFSTLVAENLLHVREVSICHDGYWRVRGKTE